jgi:hypothetical protein
MDLRTKFIGINKTISSEAGDYLPEGYALSCQVVVNYR